MQIFVKADLLDDIKPDNIKFFNLLDDGKWMQLRQEFLQGEKPIEELFKQLIEEK